MPRRRRDHRREQGAFGCARNLNGKTPLAALIQQGPVARDRFGLGGEAFDPHPPFDTMRAGDDAQANARGIPSPSLRAGGGGLQVMIDDG